MSEVLSFAIYFGLIVLAVYGLVWWSYKAREDRSAKVGLYLVSGIPGFLLLVAGAAASVRGYASPWGVTLASIGLGLLLPISPGFRRAVSRIGAFDPEDPVHISGLSLFFGVLFSLVAQNLLSPAPDETPEVTVGAIVVQGLFFVGLALAGVGFGIGRTFRQSRVRLGVGPISTTGVALALGVVVAGFVVNGISAVLQLAVDSDTSEAINENLEAITGGQPAIVMAPIIGLTAGIGEELVFRGLLQPRYGIVLSSLLFTALHAQYGVSFVLLGLFSLSLLLGLLAKRHGTTAAIIAHTVYNMVSVLLGSL